MGNFGKVYTEFGHMQIKDFFSFFICDYPLLAVRRYLDVDTEAVVWMLAIFGFRVKVEGELK